MAVKVVCGITVTCCNHSLNYRPIDMTRGWDCDFYISGPKTKAGNRVIPMLDEVYDALVDEAMYAKYRKKVAELLQL